MSFPAERKRLLVERLRARAAQGGLGTVRVGEAAAPRV
jgi:hypothetical protein